MNENNNIFGENNNKDQNDIFQQQVIPQQEEIPRTVIQETPIKQPVIENVSQEINNIQTEQIIKNEVSLENSNINVSTISTNEPEQQTKKDTSSGAMLAMSIFNGVCILGLIYLYLNINKLLIMLIPAFIIILSIIFAVKYKKKSDHPQGILTGGIVAGVIMFILSIVKSEHSDLFMYYTIASVIIGVVGTIISSSITTIINDYKKIKALQTIGYILLFATLIVAPLFAYKKYPEEFHKYVFFEKMAVIAKTEEDYILKTLKTRYGENFININEEKSEPIKHHINQQNQKLTRRLYKSESGIEFTVDSIEYEPSKLQYTIVDDYLEQRYYKQIKEDLSNKIKTSVGVDNIKISLFSDENCNFVADCVECEEYYSKKEEYDDIHKMYETSIKLDFQKKLTKNALDFVNNGKYKFVITATSNYAGYQINTYEDLINQILTSLNNNNIKNTYGYEIILRNVDVTSNGYGKEVYKMRGKTNAEKTFKDPEPTKEYKNN